MKEIDSDQQILVAYLMKFVCVCSRNVCSRNHDNDLQVANEDNYDPSSLVVSIQPKKIIATLSHIWLRHEA